MLYLFIIKVLIEHNYFDLLTDKLNNLFNELGMIKRYFQ